MVQTHAMTAKNLLNMEPAKIVQTILEALKMEEDVSQAFVVNLKN